MYVIIVFLLSKDHKILTTEQIVSITPSVTIEQKDFDV